MAATIRRSSIDRAGPSAIPYRGTEVIVGIDTTSDVLIGLRPEPVPSYDSDPR